MLILKIKKNLKIIILIYFFKKIILKKLRRRNSRNTRKIQFKFRAPKAIDTHFSNFDLFASSSFPSDS
jgi:hypothetical protein